MANVDRPNGLRPIRYIGGAPYTGAVNQYCFLAATGATAFVGDLVTLTGTAGGAGLQINGIDCEGMPEIKQSTANTGPHVGVIVGFLPNQADLSVRHRVASTARIALVADDPNLLFEIQEVSGGTALAATAVGLNANVVVGSGSTVTGNSGMELNNATEATTLDLDCKIVGLRKRPDNAIGEHAKWEVMIAYHSYGPDGMLGIS